MNTRPSPRRRAKGFISWIGRAALLVSRVLVAASLELRGRRRRPIRAIPKRQTSADERTIRRIAEKQTGGISSAEGSARYQRGEHRGGLHGKAPPLSPDAEVFEIEEPPARTETHRHTRRTMASTRR